MRTMWQRERGSDKPSEIYQLNLQLPAALQSFIVRLSSMFSVLTTTLLFWFTHRSHSIVFIHSRQLLSEEKL